ISMLAQFGLFFGGSRDSNSGLGVIGTLAMVILAPIAAMIVQMAISRTREYAADELGARTTGQPDALASALAKISAARDDREPHRRAHAGDGASLHRQSAERPADGHPVLDPSFDRDPHRRAGAIGGGDRFGRIWPAAERPRLSPASGRPLGQSRR